MSSPHIHNYETFTAERKRLHTLFTEQHQLVLDDISGLKEEIEPVAKVVNVAKAITHRDHSLGLAGRGLDLVVDFIVRKVLFRRAGFLEKMLASFLAKNVVSQMASKKVKKEMPIVSKVLESV